MPVASAGTWEAEQPPGLDGAGRDPQSGGTAPTPWGWGASGRREKGGKGSIPLSEQQDTGGLPWGPRSPFPPAWQLPLLPIFVR